jgi:hypothetical protein
MTMCRYAMSGPYKDRYACFHCRKAFKRRKNDDLPRAMQRADGEFPIVRCPQCRRPMHDMGMDFKAPPLKDVKQWRKVELLFEHGFTFHSCGCCGPGLMPAELREVEAFLADGLRPSHARKLLGTIAARRRERQRNQRKRPAGLAREVSGRTWGAATPPRRPVRTRRPPKAKPTSAFTKPARKRNKGA